MFSLKYLKILFIECGYLKLAFAHRLLIQTVAVNLQVYRLAFYLLLVVCLAWLCFFSF